MKMNLLEEILSQLDLEYVFLSSQVNEIEEKLIQSSELRDATRLKQLIQEALSGSIVCWDNFVKNIYEQRPSGRIFDNEISKLIEYLRKCNYIKRKKYIAMYYCADDDTLQIKKDDEMAKYNDLYKDVQSKYSRELSSKIPAVDTTARPPREWMPWTFGSDRIPYDLDYMVMVNRSDNSRHLLLFPEDPDSLNQNSPQYDAIRFLKDAVNKFENHMSRVKSMTLDEYRAYKMSQPSIDEKELEQMINEIDSMSKNLSSELKISDGNQMK